MNLQIRLAGKIALVVLWICCQTVVAQGQNSFSEVVIKSALVKPSEAIEIPVEQSGVLVEMNVREGSRVINGDLIARVDDRAIQQRLDKARLEHDLAKKLAKSKVDLEYAQKSYEVALSDLRRSNEANVRVANSVPAARVQKQQLESDRSRLMLQKAQHDLEVVAFKTRLTSAEIKAVQLELVKSSVKAKSNGLVISVDKKVGEWVQPSDVLCRIVRTDRLRLEGFVAAKDATRIVVGSPAKVKFAYPWMKQNSVMGEVVFVSPNANPVNLSIQVWVEIPNNGEIPAGVRGDVVVSAVSSSVGG